MMSIICTNIQEAQTLIGLCGHKNYGTATRHALLLYYACLSNISIAIIQHAQCLNITLRMSTLYCTRSSYKHEIKTVAIVYNVVCLLCMCSNGHVYYYVYIGMYVMQCTLTWCCLAHMLWWLKTFRVAKILQSVVLNTLQSITLNC